MNNFRVGEKIVCISDVWPVQPSPLKVGQVYTITGFNEPELSISFNGFGVRRAVLLAEARNDIANRDGFNPDRFRRLVERKADISIFTAMLCGKHQPIPA